MAERLSDRMQQVLLSIVEVAPLAVVGRRLAEAAMDLTGADYAAIGAYDSRHQLEHWVPVGIDEARRELIGHPPVGHGLLGAFAHTSDAIRLDDAARYPTATGMPEHHPPMGPFLGVPVVYAGQSIGAFYVTRAPGGASFTDDDRRRLAELAPYAAIAMANARAFEREQRRARAAEDLRRAAAALQDAPGEGGVAEVLRDTLGNLFDAPCAVTAWSDDPARQYQHTLAAGDDDLSARLAAWVREDLPNGEYRRDAGTERGEVVLQLAGDEAGRVALAVATGALSVDLDMSPLRELAALGSDSLAAIRRRAAEAALERYALRDEIARDLHDDLIQSIYAIGLGLRASAAADRDQLRAVLATASDELNEVIRELRAYIAQLSHGPESIGSAGLLSARLAALLRNSGDRPRWSHTIDLGGGDLPPDLERQLYLIAREAVSNVQRHARAEHASLELTAEKDMVRLLVHDDGIGFDRREAREGAVGLRSVEERVASLGGSVMIESQADRGTTITATFPLTSAAAAPREGVR